MQHFPRKSEVVSWEFAVGYMSLQAQGFPRRLHTPTSLRSSIPKERRNEVDTVILHHWKKDPDIVIDCRIYLTKGQSEKFLRKSSVLGLIAQQEDVEETEALRKRIEELPTISISEQAIEERLSTVTVTTRGKDYEYKQDYLWLMDEDDMAPALIRTANEHLADSSHEA